MTNAQDIIKQCEKVLVSTYVSQPVVLDHGQGVYAYDTDGKKYLDFAAGIAVASLGHANAKILETLNKQASRLMTCQASYATQEKLEAAQILIDNSCFDQVYFCNSGTESVEAAIKTARKWAYENKSQSCSELIAFRNSFHGRTYGAASVTEKRMSQPYFGPYIETVHFAEFNDITSVEKLISDKIAAIIIEPVQGEGGLTPANVDFLKSLRKICDDKKIVLIFDEVQAGMGRTGVFFSYENFGVEPDISCIAKGMGGGFPVGAMLGKRPYSESIVVGTHGTTFGGNPLACAVAATVMKEILKDGFLENTRQVSKVLFDGLAKIQRESNKITEIRGKGLMIGVDTVFDIKKLLRGLQTNGLLSTQAGKSTLRLTPPLILTEEQAKEALAIIEKTLKELD